MNKFSMKTMPLTSKKKKKPVLYSRPAEPSVVLLTTGSSIATDFVLSTDQRPRFDGPGWFWKSALTILRNSWHTSRPRCFWSNVRSQGRDYAAALAFSGFQLDRHRNARATRKPVFSLKDVHQNPEVEMQICRASRKIWCKHVARICRRAVLTQDHKKTHI